MGAHPPLGPIDESRKLLYALCAAEEGLEEVSESGSDSSIEATTLLAHVRGLRGQNLFGPSPRRHQLAAAIRYIRAHLAGTRFGTTEVEFLRADLIRAFDRFLDSESDSPT